jgi:hypothetical protein
METRRSRGMRGWMALWVGCALLAFTAGAARAADEAVADSGGVVVKGLSTSVEATASFHHVNRPYFGTEDPAFTPDPAKQSYDWSEGFTRVRVNFGLPQGVWLSAGGVGMGTASTDYYGTKDASDGLLDQLLIGASHIGGTGLSIVAGRQDLQVGDGFLIGDGYRDTRAALWNIPVNFYDAVRADWVRGPWHALAFGTRISPSFTEDTTGWQVSFDEFGNGFGTEVTETLQPKGNQYGGEVGWSGGEERTLAFGYFQRVDDGGTDLDARAFSLRATWDQGPFSLTGEGVIERGKQFGSVDLRGRGGHLGLTHKWDVRGEPYAQVEYFVFSGDDPTTPQDETFYPWNYRWTDWSRYYVADLMASTLVFNSDSRILKLEGGYSPFANTSVRLLLHRIDLDTASSFGGVPEGVERAFADEADLVVDQSVGDHWSAWVMGGCARPREAGKALVGGETSGQIFASVTYKFEWPGGE